MRPSERVLVILLRLSAAMLLVAVVPAVMPWEWMAAIHRWLGLGELPQTPVVGYLARSLSAMYALHGALLLCVSLDVRRYRPIVRFLAAMNIAFGSGLIVLDSAVGLPRWWILGEGPPLIGFGCLLWWLAGRIEPWGGQSTRR